MKTEVLEFANLYRYNTLENGINVPVTLKTGFQSVDFEAKLDTGASFCVFQRIHGARLGIGIENGISQKFGTVTGGFLAFGHRLTVSVLGIEFETMVFFAEEDSFSRNFLGQTGWLDHIKLGLIDYEGKLFLSNYNE